jgi:hypothetical protein
MSGADAEAGADELDPSNVYVFSVHANGGSDVFLIQRGMEVESVDEAEAALRDGRDDEARVYYEGTLHSALSTLRRDPPGTPARLT